MTVDAALGRSAGLSNSLNSSIRGLDILSSDQALMLRCWKVSPSASLAWKQENKRGFCDSGIGESNNGSRNEDTARVA
jgi:hypothetical protein